MIRSLILSLFLHAFLALLIVVMMLVSPPVEQIKPADTISVSLYRPQTTKFTSEGAPPPPPKPPEKTPPPKPAEPPKTQPVVKKAESAPKKTVAKDKEIVENTPTPLPTPKEVAKVTPKPEPTKKATPKPEKTPPPVDLDALNVATPAPSVDQSLLDAMPTMPSVSVSSPDGPAMSTSNTELGESYANMVLYMIQQNFRPPYTVPKIQCVVSFRILRDGTLSNWRIVRGCGRADLDQSAIRAVSETGQVAPLYDGYSKQYMEVEVTFEFEKKN